MLTNRIFTSVTPGKIIAYPTSGRSVGASRLAKARIAAFPVAGLIADVGFRPVYAGGSPAAFAAVDSVAGLFFALAVGRGLGRRLAFRVLTEDENI